MLNKSPLLDEPQMARIGRILISNFYDVFKVWANMYQNLFPGNIDITNRSRTGPDTVAMTELYSSVESKFWKWAGNSSKSSIKLQPDLNRAKIAVRLRPVHFQMSLNIISNLFVISSSQLFILKLISVNSIAINGEIAGSESFVKLICAAEIKNRSTRFCLFA